MELFLVTESGQRKVSVVVVGLVIILAAVGAARLLDLLLVYAFILATN